MIPGEALFGAVRGSSLQLEADLPGDRYSQVNRITTAHMVLCGFYNLFRRST